MTWYRNKWFHLFIFALGLMILVLGLLCAYVIFPDVVDKRIYREYIDLWNPNSRGRQNFVSHISFIYSY